MTDLLEQSRASKTMMISYLQEFNQRYQSIEEYEAILPECEEQHHGNDAEKREVLLTAATMWQQLEKHYFGTDEITLIDTIIYDIGQGHMGLLGPADSCLTKFAEKVFGRFTTFRLHALAHDVSGRFRKRHGLGPGYLYTIPYKENECCCVTRMRNWELMGNVCGLLNCFRHRNELAMNESFELIKIHVE